MLRKRIALFIIITLLAPIVINLVPGIGALSAKEVSAAAKLASTKLEIGVNSSPQYIDIDDYSSTAVYSFKSENEKIATVSELGLVSGKSFGKTQVEVSESLNGVVTSIGKITINVVEAYLDKSMKVGVNGQSYVNIHCSNYDAVYSFQSSDTKVVKVNKYGTVTGVKLGKATVSVTQKLNGKTKKLGSVKVQVVNSALAAKSIEVPITDNSYTNVPINYYNENATYKFKSANTKIAKVDKYGYVTGVKLGTTAISVTETYNKKTIKLGSITVKVMGASLDSKTMELGINSVNYLTDVVDIRFRDSNAYYYAKSEDESIVKLVEYTDEYGYTGCKISAVALGETKITVYEKKNSKSTKLGAITISVKEYPVQSFSLYDSYLELKDGKPTLTLEMNSDYSWYSMRDYLNINPYYTTTPITYSSSDETIVKINENGIITTVAAGNAVLKATCGSFTVELNVVINAVPATSLSFSDTVYDYGSDKTTFYLGWDYSYYTMKDYVNVEPYNASDKPVFSSSDDKIIKVDAASGYITPVAAGNAVITVTCGKLTATLKVAVEKE